MSAPYPELNGTLMGQDITYLMTYANQVTDGFFMPFILLSFFVLVLVLSVFLQWRTTARIRWETSYAAACFAVFGFGLILIAKTDLLNPLYFMFIILLNVIAIVALILTSDN